MRRLLVILALCAVLALPASAYNWTTPGSVLTETRTTTQICNAIGHGNGYTGGDWTYSFRQVYSGGTTVFDKYGSPAWSMTVEDHAPYTPTFDQYILTYVHCADGNQYQDPSSVHNGTRVYAPGYVPPVYANFTFIAISNTTGERVPRADVKFDYNPTTEVAWKTDLNGQVTFPHIFTGGMDPHQMFVIVSKAGYNTTNYSFTPSFTEVNPIYNIYLGDYISPGGAPATIYVDIAKASDGTEITGATVGIENTTATINPWYYETIMGSTATFNKTGGSSGINLSVGQTVVLSAYKSGEYAANNTGSYVIPSSISHVTLLLDLATGNESTTYDFPVTVTDAKTGYALTNSWLNSSLALTPAWFNRTSATGKFNVTGSGVTGVAPIVAGDQLLLCGWKTGYQERILSLVVSSSNNGVTQFIPLVKLTDVPISGEFAAVVSVSDEDTGAAISTATVTAKENKNTTMKLSGSTGIAYFPNLTSGVEYTFTASKSGYTTAQTSFTGSSHEVSHVDMPLSPDSVNPTGTVTPTPTKTGNYTSGELNDEAGVGILGMLHTLFDLWPLAVVLILLAAIKAATE